MINKVKRRYVKIALKFSDKVLALHYIITLVSSNNKSSFISVNRCFVLKIGPKRSIQLKYRGSSKEPWGTPHNIDGEDNTVKDIEKKNQSLK